MSAYKQKDMELLTEAYKITLLREQAPYMPIRELQTRLNTMSEVELQYMVESLESLNEGLGDMLRGVGNVGSAIGSGIKGLAKSAVPVAKGVGGAIASGAGQLKSNVGNAYTAGDQASKMAKMQAKADDLVNQLKALYLQAGHPEKDWDVQTVADIINLFDAAGYAQNAKDAAANVGKGIGSAMKAGYAQGKVPVGPKRPLGGTF